MNSSSGLRQKQKGTRRSTTEPTTEGMPPAGEQGVDPGPDGSPTSSPSLCTRVGACPRRGRSARLRYGSHSEPAFRRPAARSDALGGPLARPRRAAPFGNSVPESAIVADPSRRVGRLVAPDVWRDSARMSSRRCFLGAGEKTEGTPPRTARLWGKTTDSNRRTGSRKAGGR